MPAKLLLFLCLIFASLTSTAQQPSCIGATQTISFSNASIALTPEAKKVLAGIAAKMRSNAACKIVVTSTCSDTKTATQRSWDRINGVMTYLFNTEGIAKERIYWDYLQTGGNCNVVTIRGATQNDKFPVLPKAPNVNLRVTKF